jgi:hypothetical protein
MYVLYDDHVIRGDHVRSLILRRRVRPITLVEVDIVVAPCRCTGIDVCVPSLCALPGRNLQDCRQAAEGTWGRHGRRSGRDDRYRTGGRLLLDRNNDNRLTIAVTVPDILLRWF